MIATLRRVALLQASNLVKAYSGRRVVDGVSFEVNSGEVVGLLGRNGAGKTTSFRMAIGMITPEGGIVHFDGRDVTFDPMYRHALSGMGYLSQEPSVFQRLTCEENLLAILETQALGREQRKKRAQELLEQFGLKHKAKDEARTCSGGERRRLEIARALVTQPDCVLADEPTGNLDRSTAHGVFDLMLELAQSQGTAFVLVTHDASLAARCQRRLQLVAGRLSELTV